MGGDANLNEPEWDNELLEEPFRLRAMRIGQRAGARELGATLYEIEPGGAISPYHAHHGNEELLLVLAGRPRLRTPTPCATWSRARLSRSRAGRLARTASRTLRPRVGPHASC